MEEVPLNSCPFPKVTIYPDNHFLADAWHSALLFAAGEPDLIAQFEQDTGHPGPKKSISGLASGQLSQSEAEDALMQFVFWFNLNVWCESPFPGA